MQRYFSYRMRDGVLVYSVKKDTYNSSFFFFSFCETEKLIIWIVAGAFRFFKKKHIWLVLLVKGIRMLCLI